MAGDGCQSQGMGRQVPEGSGQDTRRADFWIRAGTVRGRGENSAEQLHHGMSMLVGI